MKDITVIIPVHEYNDEIKTLLQRALKSIPIEYNVSIATTKVVSEQMGELSVTDNVAIEWYSDNEGQENEKTDFATLVNYAVKSVETKYFSILEYDDEYTDIWFKNAEVYMEKYPEMSVLLPLTDLVDFTNNRFLGYGNEAPWASSFSSAIGYIDNDSLQQFFDFYLTGSVFNTEDWKNLGGLKPSIKLTFWYEFLLRYTNKGKKVFVVPKVGYKHYVNRQGSLFDNYRNTVSEKESAWWFDLAKQECFFKEDRNKTYENNQEGEE